MRTSLGLLQWQRKANPELAWEQTISNQILEYSMHEQVRAESTLIYESM
jgi:hypothetical protein